MEDGKKQPLTGDRDEEGGRGKRGTELTALVLLWASAQPEFPSQTLCLGGGGGGWHLSESGPAPVS